VYLQLALDLIELEAAEALIAGVKDSVDILEAGTPLIVRYGISAVRAFKRLAPEKLVLADVKIMDAGNYEAALAFENGADIVTVLAAAEDATIKGAVKEAAKWGKKTMADLIAVNDPVKRALQVAEMGVDYVCVHTATDVQSEENNPLKELQLVKGVLDGPVIAVAGGVNLKTLPDIMRCGPEIVIVGSAVTGSGDAANAAARFKEMIAKGV
jgi:3-hexulose-6-phosphate synthase